MSVKNTRIISHLGGVIVFLAFIPCSNAGSFFNGTPEDPRSLSPQTIIQKLKQVARTHTVITDETLKNAEWHLDEEEKKKLEQAAKIARTLTHLLASARLDLARQQRNLCTYEETTIAAKEAAEETQKQVNRALAERNFSIFSFLWR